MNGDPLARNGVVDEGVKVWELWVGSILSRELDFPDSRAEGGCSLSLEIDLGGAYLA